MSRRQLAQMAEIMDGSHLLASLFAVCRSEDIGQKARQAWRLALPGRWGRLTEGVATTQCV